MTQDVLNVLFLGDIVGRPGRYIVREYLNELRDKPDFIVANVENASHGFGLTQKNYEEILSYGVNAMTSGNHIWDRKDIFSYIDKADNLLRPLNYPLTVPGKGSGIFAINNVRIGVVNLLGRVFMEALNNPYEALEEEIKRLKYHTPIVLVDFHAEATAEKQAAGIMADNLGASVFVGTHTHVQTSDEKILENGCAYITDVGFCGSRLGIIGMDAESSMKKLKTFIPQRYDVAPIGEAELNGVNIVIDTRTGKAKEINRIRYIKDLKRGTDNMKGK